MSNVRFDELELMLMAMFGRFGAFWILGSSDNMPDVESVMRTGGMASPLG